MANFLDVHRKFVGGRIRKARVRAGLSHDGLAEKVGTSRQHLIKLEKGMHLPRPEMLAAIAEATGKEAAYFESDDEDESSMPMTGEAEFLEALRPLARLGARIDALERMIAARDTEVAA